MPASAALDACFLVCAVAALGLAMVRRQVSGAFCWSIVLALPLAPIGLVALAFPLSFAAASLRGVVASTLAAVP